MNSGKRRDLAMGLLLIAAVACASKKPAYDTIDKLDNLVAGNEALQREQLEAILTVTFEQSRERTLAVISAKQQELKVYVYQRTEERIVALTESSISQLEGLLKPIVDELQEKLKSAREQAAESGNRTKEFDYASQLGATLTAHARESVKLIGRIRTRFQKVRDDNLKNIDVKFAKLRSDPNVVPPVGAQASEILKKYDEGSNAYKATVHDGLVELRRFIRDNNRGISFLAKSFAVTLGKGFGVDVSARADTWIAKAESAAQDLGKEVTDSLDKSLAETKVE